MKKFKYLLFIFMMIFIFAPNVKADEIPEIKYQSHVQSYGWMDWTSNGKTSGTEGQSKRLEAIKIKIDNIDGSIEYKSHVQSYGWMNWVKNGEMSGTEGQTKRLEAIKIKLTGNISEKYDIYYRSHVQSYGWMNWVKNGEMSGTEGQAKRLEAIEIKLIDKTNNVSILYKVNVDGTWQDYVNNGEMAGTTGESKPIQSLNIRLDNFSSMSGNVEYTTYTSPSGWQGYVSSSNNSGISGNNIEAIKIKLTGELEQNYDIYYRVHTQSFGWMDWTKNDNIAGTIGYFKRVEAIEIKLENKNMSSIQTGPNSYKKSNNKIKYQSHVQSIGWQDYVSDGEVSGTTGNSKRLEAIKIKIDTGLDYDIQYQTYVEGRGWQSYVSKDTLSGTEGKAKKLEAIKMKLVGPLSENYDIYYRVHVSKIGWMDWAKNDAKAGSVGSDTQIEAIQIKLVHKKSIFNESTSKPYVTGKFENNYYKDYFGNKVTGFKFIDGIKYYFNSEGTMIGKNVKKVIDVSQWQGLIDWDRIKNNEDVDAAIIRVGWGMSYTDEAGTDSYFDYNIKSVQRLGIPYSIYIYGYAKADYAAVKEANFVISKMRQYNIPSNTYVWYDAEINTIPLSTYNIVIPKFIDTMHANGYNNVGVYGSLNNFVSSSGNLNSSKIRSYPLWVAQYYKKDQYPSDHMGWQYTSDASIDGINGRVDASVFYK